MVDGNVERVLGRMFGGLREGKPRGDKRKRFIDRERPGDFNQAMMELGATLCTPRTPQCVLCPLNAWCQSRSAEAVRPRAPRKRRELRYALVERSGSVLLVQRPADASLMAGMWELPSVPEDRRNGNEPVAKLRHSITDTDYDVSVISVLPDDLPSVQGEGSLVFAQTVGTVAADRVGTQGAAPGWWLSRDVIEPNLRIGS